MEGLAPYIYHEKQESGSMMCGQHALNSLLQNSYFSPPDLAQIAHELDELEQNYSEGSTRGRSTNMDDTGYFSVQVLENALKNAFGLTLVRWRSEEMRKYQPVPDTQLAFVLNLQQHWFTLRRFGRPGGKGLWFNLNSFLPAPEWVGNTYLGMVLQQAEQEGYSVFAVRPLDPDNPENTLPETEADLIAETLDATSLEGQRPSTQISTARAHSGTAASESASGSGSGSAAKSPPPAGLESEDLELQRALQASLAAGYGGGSGMTYEEPTPSAFRTATASTSSSRPGPRLGYSRSASSSGPPSRRTPIPDAEDPPTPQFETSGESDPVAASATRARRRLEQMQREQAAAMQGMGSYGFGAGMADAVERDPGAARRRMEAQERVRRAREEEEEQIRLAMAESLKTHEENQGGSGGRVDEDEDDDDEGYFVTPPAVTSHLPPSGLRQSGASARPFGAGDRNYDDEDAELQAALKASLEDAGTGLTVPSEPTPAPRVPTQVPAPIVEPTEEDEDEVVEEETKAPPSPEVEAKAEVADPDELRRRRLARFGG